MSAKIIYLVAILIERMSSNVKTQELLFAGELLGGAPIRNLGQFTFMVFFFPSTEEVTEKAGLAGSLLPDSSQDAGDLHSGSTVRLPLADANSCAFCRRASCSREHLNWRAYLASNCTRSNRAKTRSFPRTSSR